jgi:hypothetical protein
MYLKQLVEWLFVAFILIEVALPLMTGKPLFPIIRRQRAARLLAEQERLRQQLEEDAIRQQNQALQDLHKTNLEKENQDDSNEHTDGTSGSKPTAVA